MRVFFFNGAVQFIYYYLGSSNTRLRNIGLLFFVVLNHIHGIIFHSCLLLLILKIL